ncbi:MAG: glycosyltransferase family 4 protein [Candidatus Heimdallarchaeota archaeon]|nr:glycosyltransferase family 4 protein [Candidatus Heimdallarchaeota archaeon]
MKLLIENTCFFPIVGGTETYSYQFLATIAPVEASIKLLCQYPVEGPQRINGHAIVRYGDFDLKSGYHPESEELDRVYGMSRIINNEQEALEAWKKIKSTNLNGYYQEIFAFDPDIILINDVMRVISVPYLQELLYLTKAKLVVNLHGILTSFRAFWEEQPTKKKLLKELFQSNLPIDYLAPSRFVYEEALKWGIAEERLHQIYLGVDTSFFTRPSAKEKERIRKFIANKFPDAKQKSLNLDCLWFVFPSRAVSHKGIDTVLEALERLSREKPEHEWLLIIAGGSSDNPESIYNVGKLIEEYTLKGEVLIGIDKFLNYPEDMKLLNQAADVCLFPSRREALGYGAIESMACGVPVIGTSIPGLAEVLGVPEGSEGSCDAGWAIKPEDSQGLAEVLEELLEKPEGVGEKKQKQARKWVEENFSLEKMIKQHRELFYQLTAASREHNDK